MGGKAPLVGGEALLVGGEARLGMFGSRCQSGYLKLMIGGPMVLYYLNF